MYRPYDNRNGKRGIGFMSELVVFMWGRIGYAKGHSSDLDKQHYENTHWYMSVKKLK